MEEQPMPPPGQTAPPSKKGLFVIKSSKPKDAPMQAVTPQDIAAISGRLKVIEERLFDIRRKSQITDQNMLANNKKIAKDMKNVDNELKDFAMDIDDLRTVVQQIITEMKKFASKNELDILKKYVDLWEPLNFVSRKEVERIVEEAVENAVISVVFT